jgi:dolichol-phosphate mannosyltransferase
MDVSVVIPIYNARDFIRPTIAIISQVLTNSHIDYEILLQDDGSTDGSIEQLQRIAREDPRIRCFYEGRNQGLGYTLRELLDKAQAEQMIYLDVDLPFGAAILPQVVNQLNTYDLVVLSRYQGNKNRISLDRWIASRVYYALCKTLFDIAVVDLGSGTVGIRKSAVSPLNLKASGFDIHIELFAKARREGLRVKEIAAATTGAGQRSFQLLRHGPKTVWQTAKLWNEFRGQRRQR